MSSFYWECNKAFYFTTFVGCDNDCLEQTCSDYCQENYGMPGVLYDGNWIKCQEPYSECDSMSFCPNTCWRGSCSGSYTDSYYCRCSDGTTMYF